MCHKRGIRIVQRATIIIIFAVLNINGGAAYVDRKRNQGQRKEDRQQASRIKCTETDAIYLVQLKRVSRTKLRLPST
jgi:hypothetical protein